MRNLQNKIALVTGAASGIGRALSLELAKEGAHLVITDINDADLADGAQDIKRLGRDVLPIKADISSESDVKELCTKALNKFNCIDILVNNAGVALYADFLNTRLSDWQWLMGIDLWGPIFTSHYLVPQMVERKSGHIVNISSWMGLLGQPNNSAYSAAKFGVVGLSEALRIELHKENIGVTVVCPGVVRTNIFRNLKIRGFKSDIRNMPAFLGLTPERISKRIVRAIKSNQATVITDLGKFAYGLKRLSPAAARIIGHGMMRMYSRLRNDQ